MEHSPVEGCGRYTADHTICGKRGLMSEQCAESWSTDSVRNVRFRFSRTGNASDLTTSTKKMENCQSDIPLYSLYTEQLAGSFSIFFFNSLPLFFKKLKTANGSHIKVAVLLTIVVHQKFGCYEAGLAYMNFTILYSFFSG